MSFYKCISFITFIYFHLVKITNAFKGELKILETGLDLVLPNSIGLTFYLVVNNTSEDDNDVELRPEQCCFKNNFDLDCDTFNVIGNCQENIPKGSNATLKLVAPILNPFERHGYCLVTLASKLRNRRKNTETVKIDFDIDDKIQYREGAIYIKKCKNIDEDPLNDCRPVECDTYYNGRKIYYNKRSKRCVRTPVCVSNSRSELPHTIYDPISNICVHGRSISKEDIEFIKSLEKPIKAPTIKTHELRLANINDSYKMDDLANNPLRTYDPLESKKPVKIPQVHGRFYENCRIYIINNKFTLLILFTVVLIQCCLISALGYYVTNKCDCCRKKKKVHDLFNYKTDATLTTPLIFSNTNTETTDYQYYSESSNNILKKINCYKSCQKERNKDMKVSISDDILSKCLTRRDWIDNKNTKSEAISGLGALKPDLEMNKIFHNAKDNNIHEKDNKTTCIAEITKKYCEPKVAFEDETSTRNHAGTTKSNKESISHNASCDDKMKHERKDSDTLEKEIRSHSYDCLNSNSDIDKTPPNTNILFNNNKSPNEKHVAISLSTNKGAQACFSNDSIDDFLSERGIFLAGDDFSKYSFSCPSNQAKLLSSEISSKTSKNNIVRNMLSLLQRRSKHCVSSDPGISMKNNQLDVELLHMSRASVFSTSNDSECIKEFKPQDSRTSL